MWYEDFVQCMERGDVCSTWRPVSSSLTLLFNNSQQRLYSIIYFVKDVQMNQVELHHAVQCSKATTIWNLTDLIEVLPPQLILLTKEYTHSQSSDPDMSLHSRSIQEIDKVKKRISESMQWI